MQVTKKTQCAVVALCVLCGMASAFPAKAQDLGGALDLGQLGRDLSFAASMRAQARRDAARLKGHHGGSGNSTHTTSHASTRFTPDLALRKRNLSQIVAKARATNPQTGAALEKAFAKDPIATVAPGLARYGLKTNDVADAVTSYLVTAWYGARGSTEDPPRAQVEGVQRQMRSALLNAPAFAVASNATKQQMTEGLLVQTMLTDATLKAAKSNPTQLNQVKAAIRQGALSTFKLDLAKIQLADGGFRL